MATATALLMAAANLGQSQVPAHTPQALELQQMAGLCANTISGPPPMPYSHSPHAGTQPQQQPQRVAIQGHAVPMLGAAAGNTYAHPTNLGDVPDQVRPALKNVAIETDQDPGTPRIGKKKRHQLLDTFQQVLSGQGHIRAIWGNYTRTFFPGVTLDNRHAMHIL